MKYKPAIELDDTGEGSIRGRMFYPLARVDEVFLRMRNAKGTPQEAEELRIFAARMERLYGFSYELNAYADDAIDDNSQDKDEALLFRWAGIGEAFEDAELIDSMTGGKESVGGKKQ
jgi:hypothetical protein